MKKLITLTLFLLLFSCQDNESFTKESTSHNTNNLNIWRYPVARILKSEPKLKNQLDQLKAKKLQNKTTSSIYNFSIEETEAQVIFETNYTQYTFEIARENVPANHLENYICKIYTNGEVEQFLISYPYSIVQNNIVYDGSNAILQVIHDDNLIIGSNSQGNRAGCVPELISETYDYTCTSIPCHGEGAGGHEFGNHNCECGVSLPCTPASQECGWVGTFVYGCAGGSSSGPTSPGGDGGLGTGTGGSTGTNPINTNDPIITVPFQINKMEVKIVNYLNENTDIEWLDILPEMQEDILNYFNNDSMFTDENKLFLVEILNRIQQNEDLFTSIKPFLIEKQIDDSQLDPCAQGVFQEVKNTTNNDFAKVLAKLDADGTVYNTTMVSAVAPSGAPAQTKRTSSYNYKIYISTDYGDKTKLFIASLQLHELVHAYFYSLIDDCLIQNDCQLLATFPELWEYYVSVCDNQYPSNPSSHHEQIANRYVNAIADALQEYQPGLPQHVYEDLAWSGLEETEIFNTLHPIGSDSRLRISNRKAAEQSGHPVNQGTAQGQINYGQPCN